MGSENFSVDNHTDHLVRSTFHFLRQRAIGGIVDKGVLLVGESYMEEVYSAFERHIEIFDRYRLQVRRQGLDGDYKEREWCTLNLDKYFDGYGSSGAAPIHELMGMGIRD